jgi:hypothetical protein
MIIAAATDTPVAENTMVFFGMFFIVGILFVGMLILGAALAAKPDTRTAGLWVMGVTFAVAVALPLAWLFVGFAAPAHQAVRGGDGRVISASGPAWATFGLFILFAAVAGTIALLVNPRTRKAGWILVGAGVVFLVGYLFVGVSTVRVTHVPPVAVSTTDHHSSGVTISEDLHQIPVESESGTMRVTPNDPAAAPPSTAPPAVAPPAATEPSPAAEPPVVAPPSTTPVPAPLPPAQPGPTAAADRDDGHGNVKGAAIPPEALEVIPPGERSTIPMTTGDKDSLPEWAKQGGGIAPDGTYFTVVKCGPNLNFDTCWNELRRKVEEAARDYRSRSMWGDKYHPPYPTMPEQIRNQLMAEHFLERGDSSVGETMTLYTRVVFTPQAMGAVRAWQKDLLAENRMLFATIVGGLVVGMVAVAYGYFRIDTATLGYYSWRLRFVALFFVIGIVIAGIAAGAVYFEQEWRLGGFRF